MKTLTNLFIAFFLFFSFAANAQKAVFIFSAPEGEEIIKINEDKHEKSVNFYVTGLNTADEVNALTQKMTTTNGVKTFTISEEVVDGKRAASGTFEGCGSMAFYRDLLVNAGVEDIIVNGEPLKSIDLEKVWKTKPLDTHTNPTGAPVK